MIVDANTHEHADDLRVVDASGKLIPDVVWYDTGTGRYAVIDMPAWRSSYADDPPLIEHEADGARLVWRDSGEPYQP